VVVEQRNPAFYQPTGTCSTGVPLAITPL